MLILQGNQWELICLARESIDVKLLEPRKSALFSESCVFQSVVFATKSC